MPYHGNHRQRLQVPPIRASVLVATLMLNVLALAQPLAILQIFDRIIPFQSIETLFFLFLGLCLVVALEFVLRAARTVLLVSQGERFEQGLAAQFLERMLRADPEAFAKSTPAANLDKFGAIAHLRAHYAGQGRILSIDLPFAAIFVAMIGLIGGWLIVVPLACIVLLLGFTKALQRAQSSIFEKRLSLDSRRYSFLVEALSQIRTLKANTMEPQILRRYELLQEQTVDISERVIRFSGLSQSFGALFSQFAVAAMGLFGSFLIIQGQIGIAELAACMLLNGRTVQPMLKALGLWVQSENIGLSRRKVEDALSIAARRQVDDPPVALTGGVTLDGVALCHPARDTNLFENLSASVAAGQCLLVTGSAGAGKSSLLKLILGELTPTAGAVLIDGRPATDFLSKRGHRGVAYVDHRPVLFSGTVLENISAYGDGEAIERALELSARLGIERHFNRLPLGYNTEVLDCAALTNNRAATYGISLVRALSLQPKILLLNNVSATMDDAARTAFEALVRDLKGATTIVISESSDHFRALADHHIQIGDDDARALDKWDADAAAEEQQARSTQRERGVA